MSVSQEDIDLLMSQSEIREIEDSSLDPVAPTKSSVFDQEKAKQMIPNIYPDADVTTVEACLSLSLYHQVMKTPLPKSDDEIVQQINDLLNEDAAPTPQPEIPSDARPMEIEVEAEVDTESEQSKIPRIVFTPEVQVIQDRKNSVWMRLDTPTDVHRLIIVTEDEDWPTTFSDLRQQIESKRKAPPTPEKIVEPKPSMSNSA